MKAWSDIQAALSANQVVLLPTETVYGIAANAESPDAIDKIYAIKGRDFDKPLAVCIRNIEHARKLGVFEKISLTLAERHWPGSLTLVLNLRPGTELDRRVTGNILGQRTIALRCPEASWRSSIDRPLALTSANKSGEADCVEYETAMKSLGDGIAAGLKAKTPLSGAPSTIIRVDAGKLTLLRQGALEVSI